MSGRSITTAMQAALDAGYVQWFPLVFMDLDSGPLYVCGAPFDVEWDGNTYSTLHGMGSIEPITETDTRQSGLAFVLSGVPESAIATVLTEHVQGRPVVVRLAVVADGALHVDPNVWSGQLDVLEFSDGESPQVRVTAEHHLIAWEEPAGLMFSDADQQRLHPGDLFFANTASLVEATIVWPTAATLRAEAGG